MSSAVADLTAAALLLVVAVYSTAGGTDFGAGIWDLLAGPTARGERARALIDHAMGPVWEANNVWLVFAAVLTWTGFPRLWQSAFLSLYPLFALSLLGLVLRGAFFAFRKPTRDPTVRRAATLAFGVSSVLTPFCFAASLGAIASGRVGVGGPTVPLWQANLNPTSVAFGLVSVAATAFSGASFLVGDARRYGAEELVGYFRSRAIVAALGTLALAAVALGVMGADTPKVFRGMVAGLGLPFAILAVVAMVVVAALLYRRVYLWFRVLTVVAVGSFVMAWGFGQSPYLLPGTLTIADAAGTPSSQVALLVIATIALAITAPSLALLYVLDQRNDLVPPDEAAEHRGGQP